MSLEASDFNLDIFIFKKSVRAKILKITKKKKKISRLEFRDSTLPRLAEPNPIGRSFLQGSQKGLPISKISDGGGYFLSGLSVFVD
jgi:hypothetical protein